MSEQYGCQIVDPDNIVGAYLLCMSARIGEMSERELALYDECLERARPSEPRPASQSILSRLVKKVAIYL